MTFTERLKLSVITGTISALLIMGSVSRQTDSSLFFSRLFFGSTIDRSYTPPREEEDKVVFGCWIFEFFAGLFS